MGNAPRFSSTMHSNIIKNMTLYVLKMNVEVTRSVAEVGKDLWDHLGQLPCSEVGQLEHSTQDYDQSGFQHL